MTAKREPCPDCRGLGHLCNEESDHIHYHDEVETCPTCEGRGSVPIETDEPESPAPDQPTPDAPDQPVVGGSVDDDQPDPGEE